MTLRSFSFYVTLVTTVIFINACGGSTDDKKNDKAPKDSTKAEVKKEEKKENE